MIVKIYFNFIHRIKVPSYHIDYHNQIVIKQKGIILN